MYVVENPSLITPPRVRRRLAEIEQREIAALQDWTCAGCQKRLPAAFDIDHRIPFSVGGADDSSNYQALCPTCHAFKSRIERSKIQILTNIWKRNPRALVCYRCEAIVSRFFVKTHSCQTQSAAVRHAILVLPSRQRSSEPAAPEAHHPKDVNS